MHHPTDRIAHITAFVTPVVEHWLEQEIAGMVIKAGLSNHVLLKRGIVPFLKQTLSLYQATSMCFGTHPLYNEQLVCSW